jgi:signal transduction histidine kinase
MVMALNRQPGDQAAELLATIAHDLRQPLTVVRVSTELLRRRAGYANGEAAPWLDHSIAEIEEAGLRMEQLINEFIDLAQIQSGLPLSLSRDSIDLVEIATHVVGAVQADSAGRHVHLELAQPSVIGCWDGSRLRRVLENLLNNAIKYSAPGGDIVMRVGDDLTVNGDWAVLAVRDHGRGIPAGD